MCIRDRLYAVTPGVIISAMQREYDAAEAGALLTALLLAAGTHLSFILLARLRIRERSGNQNIGVERFALVMSNSSYIGIPMVQAVLGEDGVFFLTDVYKRQIPTRDPRTWRSWSPA